MASPRPYVAAAAAAVLAALYFVPSAHASTPAVATTATTRAGAAGPSGGLAETGMIDTKPYVIGGAVFLVAGAGLVVNATRRSRHALQAAEAEVGDPSDEGAPEDA